jgi:PAS domain S-box-containing protein
MAIFLDIPTLSFVMGVTIFALSFSMLYYATSRKIYPGFGLWTKGTVLISLAFFLIGFRQSLSSFITIVAPNALIYAALAMFYLGFKSFAEKKGNPYLHTTIVLLLSFVLVPYFTYFIPNVNARIILISYVAALYFFFNTLVLVKEIHHDLAKLNKMLTATLISMSCLLAFRGTFFLLPQNTIDNYMSAGIFHGIALLAVMILGIFFVVGLMQLNSQKLEKDLYRDQEELRESEERYRHLVDQSLQGLVIAQDNPLRFTFVSKPIEAITGYSKEEMLNLGPQQLMDLIHIEDRDMFFQNFKARLSGKEVPSVYECRIIHKSMGIRWVELYASIVEYGDRPAVHAVFLDITKRKQTEKDLLGSEQFLDNIFNSIQDGISVLNPDLSIRRVNGVMKQWYPEKLPLEGKKCFQCYQNSNSPCDPCPTLRCFNSGQTEMDIVPGPPNSDVEWIELYSYPMKGEKPGEIAGVVEFVRDITERVKAQESIHESEEKYRLIMAAMNDAAYITSKNFEIEYMNPKMFDIIGRDATEELCYKAIYNRSERCPWCIFDQILEGKEYCDYELTNPKDNSLNSVTNSPIYHSDGTISKLTILRDITEKKTIEEQLRQARKMESIGTMAGGVAHDFNNILYMITGNAELAMEDIPEWNPVHANLKEIKSAGLRAAGIVKQLLTFSRKTEHEMMPIGAITVIKDSLKFLRSTIPTSIEIRESLPDREMTILGDPIQINQIMMNICINASQAMEETGGVLKINVEKEILQKNAANNPPDLAAGDYLKIMISDKGPGIDPEIIDRIFDPYFTTKDVGKGSGMGLAVVQGLIQNHNGAIIVDSNPGEGSTFTILFPLVDKELEMEVGTFGEIPDGSETILFIDDEKSIANMVGKILKRLGYEVVTKTNPVEAVELIQAKPDHFDLVITDMTMPQMSGVKLSAKLKDMRSDIPVIICTGHSSLIDEEKAKQLGIDAYVMKPIVKREIAKTIRKVLDEAK